MEIGLKLFGLDGSFPGFRVSVSGVFLRTR